MSRVRWSAIRGSPRWVLHQTLEHANVALHVGAHKTDQGTGLVAQLPQHRIDDLHVRSVTVDEDDAIEAVVNEAARHIVHDRQQRGTPQCDGSSPLTRVVHVLR